MKKSKYNRGDPVIHTVSSTKRLARAQNILDLQFNICARFKMFEVLALLCLVAVLVVLIILAIIDLRIGLLPNVYNGALAVLGLVFHGLTRFIYLDPIDVFIGGLVGAGFLYAVRFVANRYYQEDTLGLGDVKLMGAAGLLLGPDHILIALIIGALAGLVHGGLVFSLASFKAKPVGPLSTFSIPAGPGFCFGIVAAGVAKYWPFVHSLF